MKNTIRQAATPYFVACALLLGAVTVRADDEAKTRRRQHRQEATRHADSADKKPLTAIPTRDDRSSQETKGHVVGGANGPEYRVRTGSHLPERYNRRGYSTDSRDNEFIYDKNDIRLQSKNNVGDSLRNVPGVSVRGLR